MMMFRDSEMLSNVMEVLSESKGSDLDSSLFETYEVMSEGETPDDPLCAMMVQVAHDVVRKNKKLDLQDVVSLVGDSLKELSDSLHVYIQTHFSPKKHESNNRLTTPGQGGKRIT